MCVVKCVDLMIFALVPGNAIKLHLLQHAWDIKLEKGESYWKN